MSLRSRAFPWWRACSHCDGDDSRNLQPCRFCFRLFCFSCLCRRHQCAESIALAWFELSLKK